MSVDLLKFCSKDESRFHLHSPFSKGQWTYATNGHLAIRVAHTDVPENTKAPDCEKLFATAIEKGEPPWVDLPPFKLERKRCSDCKGTGFLDENGESCSEHSKDGYECENCEGGVIYSGRAIVKAEKGDVVLAARYLDLLKDLPGIKIGVCGDESKRIDKPIRFKFDGGDGLLMPIRM